MDQFFKTIGILATLAALSYGAYQLHQSKGELIDTFFWGFGILTFVLLIVGGLAYARYGKYWPIKFYAGKKLADSVQQLFVEMKDPEGVKEETKAEVVSHVFWRLTRIGIFGILLAGLPVFFLWQQNILFERQNRKIDTQVELFKAQNDLFVKQNEKVDLQLEKLEDQNVLITDQNTNVATQTELFQDQHQLVGFQNRRLTEQIDLMETQNDRLNLQNNLIEADRRSSLVFLMSNILDKVDEEIKAQRDTLIKKPGFVEDNVKYKLSKPLVNRIVGLSRAFKPYRVMQGDTLSQDLQSPERGQLFIALMENNLDSITQNTIVANGDFSNAIIRMVNLHNADLREANLFETDLAGADLRKANLFKADLSNANLIGADLSYAYLRGAFLHEAYIAYAELRDAYLQNADLRNTDLSHANLFSVDLIGADLSHANLLGANLREANFYGVRSLTKEQLAEVMSLYKCRNLVPKLEKELLIEKPCLFTEEGCK